MFRSLQRRLMYLTFALSALAVLPLTGPASHRAIAPPVSRRGSVGAAVGTSSDSCNVAGGGTTMGGGGGVSSSGGGGCNIGGGGGCNNCGGGGFNIGGGLGGGGLGGGG